MEEHPIEWSPLPQRGTPPQKRSGATLTEANGMLYLFGGLGLRDPPGPNNDLFVADVTAEEMVWNGPDGASECPVPPRWKHTTTHLGDGQLLVFGGFLDSTVRLNDTWVYSTETGEWFQPDSVSATSTPAAVSRKSLHDEDDEAAALNDSKREYLAELGAGGDAAVAGLASVDRNPLAPSPRGAHSAVLVRGADGQRSVWVFGGYGGAGFSRRDFNDIFRFNVETLSWVKVDEIEGEAPPARAGHAAMVSGTKMYIYGGWSSSEKFRDTWCFDTEELTWSKVDTASFGPYRWNMAALSVVAVPNWLFFVLGGSAEEYHEEEIVKPKRGGGRKGKAGRRGAAGGGGKGGGKHDEDEEHEEEKEEDGGGTDLVPGPGGFMKDILVYDTGRDRWMQLETSGEPPRARSDAAMAYVPSLQRLIVFGGWANRWFDDAASLDVRMVVGPPYAVLDVDPKIGPITGGSELTIKGLGFPLDTGSSGMQVRFLVPGTRRFQDASGKVQDSTTMICNTPAFDNLVPGEVEIRIAARGNPLTITSLPFTLFDITDAGESVCFGPGLVDGAIAGTPTSFYIRARDTSGRNRFTGSDVFKVTVQFARHVTSGEGGGEGKEDEDGEDGSGEGAAGGAAAAAAATPMSPATPAAGGAPSFEDEVEEVDVEIEDLEDGRYLVSYTAPHAGKAKVNVEFDGTFGAEPGTVRGMPMEVTIGAPGSGSEDANSFRGPLMIKHLQAELKDLNHFSKATLDGLLTEVPEDNLETLLAVKNHITAVITKEQETRLRLDAVEEAIEQLRRQAKGGKDREAEKLSKQHGTAVKTWKDCRKQMPMTRIAIQPLVKVHSAATKEALADWEKEVEHYCQDVTKLPYWKFETGYEESKKEIAKQREEHKKQWRRMERQQFLAETFEFPHLVEPALDMMRSVDDETDTVEKLWELAHETSDFIESSKEQKWAEVKAEELEEGVKKLMKRQRKMATKRIRTTGMYRGLDKELKDFLSTCPLVADLGHKSMRPRHWTKLMEATSKTFTPPYEDPDMKLRAVLDLNLHEFAAEVEEITDQSLKEEKMEEGLALLEETWSSIEFLTEPYKEVNLLKIGEEDFETLEAHQLLVQGMCANRYMATFKDQILGWRDALNNVGDVRSLLGDIQQLWRYLEPLFVGSDEVKRELPEDSERFAGGHADVIEILATAGATKNVKEACNLPGLMKRLEGLLALLEKCKKALDDFLAGKRAEFPRFYFVSDPDLLDILSNGSNPRKVMRHVTKIFLATGKIVLDGGAEGEEADRDGAERPTAKRFITCVGKEDLPFDPPVQLNGKVEKYLQVILDGVRGTLAKALDRALQRFPTKPRTEWLMDRRDDGAAEDPAQISLLVCGMDYVRGVEEAFRKLEGGDANALREYSTEHIAKLNELIRLTRTKLAKSDRSRIMCAITLDAHGRDVLLKLIREEVNQVSAFQWQSQLKQRYEDGKAVIRVADAFFPYGFEYLGNGSRLVITPLTDRIYVTATQALKLRMGCAPAGPAGTGKTETTKDLASALGVVCYVFNCSPEHDYTSLGNIFKGLSAAGAWGCFDEFNRLIPAVLSVCAVQFKAVCDGIKQNRDTVTINGETVSLRHSAGVFITMNPGYLGRSELPEGLKTLFRPITVMVPDLVLICENMLMAEGFEEAKVLASKFYGLYSLLRDLLSKQKHYDWGLRAVKSVLVVAGAFKRSEPDLPEQELLMRALRDFNTPKIVKQDEAIFFGLLGDLFPKMDPPRKVDSVLEDAVTRATKENKLHPDSQFLLKVVQLEELLEIRHCVFVMGLPGAGKSTVWRTLADARRVRAEGPSDTKFIDINPKAVIPEELYGYIHPATREWKDGVLSKVMRDLGNEEGEDPKWIVLDGDLDANWIESMNSVMDDNKMLTLASNERIPLKTHMRMIFEIRDLNFASPATVSRAGILFISTSTGSQWRSVIHSWLDRMDLRDAVKDELRRHFLGEDGKGTSGYCAETLLHLKKECRPMVPVEDVTAVSNLLRLIECLLEAEPGFKEMLDDESRTDMPKILEMYFVFAAVWAFGSALSQRDGEDYREIFNKFWRGNFKAVRHPSRDTVFDYFIDTEAMAFDHWKKSAWFTSVEYDSMTTPMSAVTVPTPETASVVYWMEKLIERRVPIMLVGFTGCGKTQLVQGILQKQDPTKRGAATINFNFYTDARVLQTNLEAPLEKRTSTSMGPPNQTKLIYFVDDLNLPEVDPYNTQSAIALLRQHFDYEHWYDRNKLELRHILDVQYLASMNPTAGSFDINPRLQRHFVTFAMGFPGATSLNIIYETFLQGHLKHFGEDVQELQSSILSAATQLHTAVASTFRKSAQNFHYEFNIRHLSGVFQGILMSRPSEFSDPAKMAMLWLHESERVYGDRLVSYDDLRKYKELAKAQASKKFSQFTSQLQNFFAEKDGDPLIFCHFADTTTEKVYNRVEAMEKLSHTLNEALQEYNEQFATMDLVLFEDAMRHVCRIARIINNPAGHALLVGVGGSGKQSLSRLASFICGYTVKQIVISSTYSMTDFRDDLKAMYNFAGFKDEGMSFLFTDSQITNERFLVAMNDLLASGNIPDLFAIDEEDEIVNNITPRVKAAGLQTDRATCWQFFLDEVRRNLHVILCFSPVGDDFRNRAKRFPALVNSTVMDRFQAWPDEALFRVGQNFLEKIPDLGSDEVRAGIEKFMPFSFQAVNRMASVFNSRERRFVYTTPKSYLELLKLYEKLLREKREESDAAITRLENGLTKLRETAESVERIEADLKISLEDAEQKRTTAEGIAEEVSANKAVVEVETANANVEAEKTAEIQKEVSAKEADAKANLAKAEPLVEQAEAALDSLNEKDLSSCKTMNVPPAGVDDVFTAVQVLLAGVYPRIVTSKSGKVRDKDRTWKEAKTQMLSDIKEFMRYLMEFKGKVDNYEVPEINWKEVRPFLELEHFNGETMMGKNPAAAGLCEWARNVVAYRDVLITVQPLRDALAEAQSRLAAANAKLAEVTEKVAGLQATLDELTIKLNEANAQKKEAIDAVEKGQRKLDLATRLTTALADENVRWAEGVERLNAEKEVLVGDVLIASAFISYIGPFTKEYRDKLIRSEWMPFLVKAAGGESIPMSDDADPLSILTNDAIIATWLSQGLPNDSVSKENGAIVRNSARWPLMIDPQLQGIKWVTKMESEAGLATVRLGQKDMLRRLEHAISNGEPVLIENMGESIEAVLNPVIARATTKRGVGRLTLQLGDKEIDYNPNFRLYLHTKLPNPHYPPEIQAETALVNFTVTETGLEDQLLALTVQKERPDLAEMKSELINQQNEFKIKMKELEDQILAKLAAAEGDITEDVELIESLERTKKVAADIAEKQIIAERTEGQINVTSEKYRPVARRGSLVFFLMNGLVRVHTYYIYSLEAFVTIFLRAIDLVSGENDPYKDEWYGEGEDELGESRTSLHEDSKVLEDEEGAESRGNVGGQEEEELGSDVDSGVEDSEEEDGGDEDETDGEEEGGGGEGEGEGEKKKLTVAEIAERDGVTVEEVRERRKKLRETHQAAADEKGITLQEYRTRLRRRRRRQARRDRRAARAAAQAAEATAKSFEIKEGLSDDQLVIRCDVLKESVTSCSFQYVNRGLFEVDKLTVAAQLCLKVLVDAKELEPEIVRLLVMGDAATDAGNCGPLADWLPGPIWPRVKALEKVKPVFEKLGDDMQADSDEWRAWFDDEKPELKAPPGDYRGVEPIHHLLLLRAMRPDRVTAALRTYIADNLGEEYVQQRPFDMAATFAESSPAVPIFFVLFPGVDPTVWVEKLGATMGMSTETGKFVNISMGQGQEANATETLERFSKEGGWVMFQNVHLMQDWLPKLERQLEIIATDSHPDFRTFISAEPPPLPYMKNMPESLMQSCIKVANEAPADLKSNLMRAWAQFSQERIDGCPRKLEFKACLFTLCWYHAVVLGRRRFGQQGWSKKLAFNDGDLTVCADVLEQYLTDSDSIPWEDLRYIFGEIMYGGHITDWWDRRTNNTYLQVFLHPGILEGMDLAPGFKAPDCTKLEYDDLTKYIVEELPKESPPMVGLHPNAEIGYLTTSAENLFKTILSLSGSMSSGDDGGSGAGGAGGGVRGVLEDILERLPPEFVMIDIEARAEPLLSEKTAPYVLVAMQECTRMNALLSEMRRSLVELRKGLDGQLNMSEPMEHLAEALSINEVPGRNPFHRTSWENLAWPSQKSLQTWFSDLLERVDQLVVWSASLLAPRSVWLPGLFNPMAFLTAVVQVTSRNSGAPLDNMAIETHVTTYNDVEDLPDSGYPESGFYTHGYYLEGARWEPAESDEPEYVVGVPTRGHLAESRLKELLPPMPVILVLAVPVQDEWLPDSVGFIRNDPNLFEAPVCITRFRGPTVTFLATLKTVDPKSKWVLAGVAIILQTDD